MASRLLTYGAPSALALAGASLMVANKDTTSSSSNTAPKGSPFDFNLTFMGETLSYKKNQVVSTVKEVGKEIKEGTSKAVGGTK